MADRLRRIITLKRCFLFLGFFFASALAGAVENSPKHIFIKSDCSGPLGSEIVTSLRDQIRASPGYQLAASLTDDGGYDVVLSVYIECTESTLPSSERIVSVASIFGTGTCTFGNCHISSNESTLRSAICSGKSGVSCGKDLYVSLDEYMDKDGGYIFRELSAGRKKALGN